MDYSNLRDTTPDDVFAAFGADPALPGMTDPYPVYAALREQAPAHWCEGPQMWAVLSYDAAMEAGRSQDLLRQPERDRLAELYGNSDIYERQKLDLPYMDGTQHRMMRRHVINAYRAIDFDALGTYIRRFADDRLAGVADADTFDLTDVLARDLPFYVVSQLLGVPMEEQGQAAEVVASFVAARGLVQNAQIADEGTEARRVFEEFFLPLIHARRDQPTGDLTSRLIADPIDGQRLSDAQMLLLVSSSFYAASVFTIRLFIGTLAMAMARNPHIYQAVRTDRSHIPVAVEEVLRWDPPAQAVNSAIAAVDLRFGDVTIPAGDAVTVMVGAANRDPAQFPDPDSIRLDRSPNRHQSFAPGLHQCLGLHLARLEACVALEALADHVPVLAYDEAESVRFVGDRFRGYERLVIRR